VPLHECPDTEPHPLQKGLHPTPDSGAPWKPLRRPLEEPSSPTPGDLVENPQHDQDMPSVNGEWSRHVFLGRTGLLGYRYRFLAHCSSSLLSGHWTVRPSSSKEVVEGQDIEYRNRQHNDDVGAGRENDVHVVTNA
jgi:hypothetical protein